MARSAGFKSCGAYMTWRPRIGTMDSNRNCISNIRPVGLPPEDAALQIPDLIELAFKHAVTGVQLNDLRGAESIPVVELASKRTSASR
jgi:ethanolamine ammonia-lyase small subunit